MKQIHAGILYTETDIPDISYNPGDDLVRDGNRYLIGKLLGAERATWRVFSRNRPGTWFDDTPPWLRTTHPKQVWPYWYLRSVRKACAPAACDLLVNASGPLIYAGKTFHSLFEPWSIILRRMLKAHPGLRFLNLGMGSLLPACDPEQLPGAVRWANVAFCRDLCSLSAVTTCRDEVTAAVLRAAGLNAPVMCCPSLLARRYYGLDADGDDYIAVNFHPAGSRSRKITASHDPRWIREFAAFIGDLKSSGYRLRFVFHEQLEVEGARRWLPFEPDDMVLPRSLPEFLRVYGNARAAFTCRIHGAYAAASFGVPSVCIAADSRAAMIDLLGLPHLTPVASKRAMRDGLESVLDRRESLNARLRRICDETEQQYCAVLREVLRDYSV